MSMNNSSTRNIQRWCAYDTGTSRSRSATRKATSIQRHKLRHDKTNYDSIAERDEAAEKAMAPLLHNAVEAVSLPYAAGTLDSLAVEASADGSAVYAFDLTVLCAYVSAHKDAFINCTFGKIPSSHLARYLSDIE